MSAFYIPPGILLCAPNFNIERSPRQEEFRLLNKCLLKKMEFNKMMELFSFQEKAQK